MEACVSISGPVELADVRVTLKLENAGNNVSYVSLARCGAFTCIYQCIVHKSFEVEGEMKE